MFMNDYLTFEQAAEFLNTSRSTLYRWLREGKLTAGHARTLVTVAEPVRLGSEIIRRGLSVREAEKLARGETAPRPKPGQRPGKDADTRALEADLSAQLGLPVVIDDKGDRVVSLSLGAETFEEERILGELFDAFLDERQVSIMGDWDEEERFRCRLGRESEVC